MKITKKNQGKKERDETNKIEDPPRANHNIRRTIARPTYEERDNDDTNDLLGDWLEVAEGCGMPTGGWR